MVQLQDMPQIRALAIQGVAGALLRSMMADALDADERARKLVVTVLFDEDDSLQVYADIHAGPEHAGAIVGGFNL